MTNHRSPSRAGQVNAAELINSIADVMESR